MRYWVYDEDGKLFRKFDNRETAIKFLLPNWKLVIKPAERPTKPEPPSPDTHGEARW